MKVLNRRGLRGKGVDYTPEHLRRLWESGKFPRPFKLSPGGHLFWNEEEIDQYFEARAGDRVKDGDAS